MNSSGRFAPFITVNFMDHLVLPLSYHSQSWYKGFMFLFVWVFIHKMSTQLYILSEVFQPRLCLWRLCIFMMPHIPLPQGQALPLFPYHLSEKCMLLYNGSFSVCLWCNTWGLYPEDSAASHHNLHWFCLMVGPHVHEFLSCWWTHFKHNHLGYGGSVHLSIHRFQRGCPHLWNIVHSLAGTSRRPGFQMHTCDMSPLGVSPVSFLSMGLVRPDYYKGFFMRSLTLSVCPVPSSVISRSSLTSRSIFVLLCACDELLT